MAEPLVRVRMYRQGLGDCFLVTFRTGERPVHMLVDCGTLGATTTGVKMADVVADIADETDKHLDLLIATHEHKDHVSGFRSLRDAFDEFQVDRVWVAWTEDADDQDARDLKRYEDDLVSSLRLASETLRIGPAGDDAGLRAMGSAVRAVLGFVGDVAADGGPLAADFAETVHEAMTYVTTRGPGRATFLEPGEVIEPTWLPGVRFYVLGPPRSGQALSELGDHDSPELYHVGVQMSRDFGLAVGFAAAVGTLSQYRDGLAAAEREAFDAGLPFDLGYRIDGEDTDARGRFLAAYDDPEEAWRQIEHEWLRVSESLALQLDSLTNNTSLVLAIELIDDGRVLLLPADAQLGNWRSWRTLEFRVTEDGATRTVTADDLLARTVFYKVGHHASHNATLNEHGLEAMGGAGLVAFIPVDRRVALNKRPHPWHMPAEALYDRLLEKTRGRTLRSDTGWPEAEDRPGTVPEETWAGWVAARGEDVVVHERFVDLMVR